MTTVPPPRKTVARTLSENGVLAQPRFVSELPRRRYPPNMRLAKLRGLAPLLRLRPHVWAAVVESERVHVPRDVTKAIRKGALGRASDWEYAVRLNPHTRRHVLFIRYVGPPVEQDQANADA